jgi:hypothetical protein
MTELRLADKKNISTSFRFTVDCEQDASPTHPTFKRRLALCMHVRCFLPVNFSRSANVDVTGKAKSTSGGGGAPLA